MIPVFDLTRQNSVLKSALSDAINGVIKGGVFILGQKVAEFETAFTKYLGVKYAVGVASGTDALTLALLALGVGSGDEVVLPANAYPTVFAITSIGAIPKLVDIDPATHNIDPQKIPQAISKKTKAIIPVHLYGQPADIISILEIGKRYKIPIIEDACQAHGARVNIEPRTKNQEPRTKNEEVRTKNQEQRTSNTEPRTKNEELRTKNKKQKTTNGKENIDVLSSKFLVQSWPMVGTIGHIGCYSFYPTKNLGCFGDGGMVVTNNPEIYEKVKMLRMYGEKKRYQSMLLGKNSRLDELQAAILLIKLKYLEKWNEKRRKIAGLYVDYFNLRVLSRFSPAKYSSASWRTASLSGVPRIVPPAVKSNVKHVYHLLVIRSKKRDQLKDFLAKRGIGTAIHYPTPIHLQLSFKFLGYKEGDFPEAERACKEVLSLPMFPELTETGVNQVCNAIEEFYY